MNRKESKELKEIEVALYAGTTSVVDFGLTTEGTEITEDEIKRWTA